MVDLSMKFLSMKICQNEVEGSKIYFYPGNIRSILALVTELLVSIEHPITKRSGAIAITKPCGSWGSERLALIGQLHH